MVRSHFGICSYVLKIAALLIFTSGFICSVNRELNRITGEQSESRTQVSPAELKHLQDAVQNSPKSFSAHLNLGLALTDLGQLRQALDEFLAAKSLRADDAQATYDIGLTYLKMAQSANLEHSPEYYEQLESAEQTLLQAFQLDPTLPEIHRHLGWLYHEIGDHDSAIREFRLEVQANPTSSEAYNNLGTALAQSENYAEAMVAYEQALAISPRSVSAAINWVSAVRRSGKKVDALAKYATEVRVHSGSAVAHLLYGFALSLNDRREEAIAQLRAALRLIPELAAAHFYLGKIWRQQNDLASAEAEYTLAVKGAPARADFLGPLAIVLLAENKPNEAESILQIALRTEPQDASLRYSLGRVLQKLGDKAGASKEFREASRLNERTDLMGQVAMLLESGIGQLRSGHVADAVRDLKQALALDPNHAETNYYLGIALSQMGDMKSSSESFERALRRRPASAEIHYNFGIALWQHGQTDRAIEEFRLATSIRPEDGLAHCALGLALRRSGDSAGGQSEVARAQSLGACARQSP